MIGCLTAKPQHHDVRCTYSTLHRDRVMDSPATLHLRDRKGEDGGKT